MFRFTQISDRDWRVIVVCLSKDREDKIHNWKELHHVWNAQRTLDINGSR